MPSKIAIAGGGISGLAAAHRVLELARARGVEVDVELIEASGRMGGAIGTEEVEGFGVVEHGADMFITDKPWALELCRRIGLEPELTPTEGRHRGSLVLREGKPAPVPAGFALMAPTDLWAMARTPILSIEGKLRAAAELLLPARAGEGDESIASFVRRRFGSELLDRLVQPLVGGIYTGDPELLSLRATLPRFIDMERDHRSVTLASLRRAKRAASERQAAGARYGLFLGMARGMQTLIAALEERISGAVAIERGARLTSVAPRAGGGYRLQLSSGRTMSCDGLVLALPAHASAELVAPFDADLGSDLRAIPYASTAIVVSGHDLADVRHPLDAFGMVIPHIERRQVLAVSFASRKLSGRAPDGSVQLRTFVGGALQPELFDLSDDRIEALALSELRDLLGVEGTPRFVRVVRHRRAMPQYHVGHLERVDRIERRTASHPGFALAGNAFRGVGIPDCVHSGERAAEQVLDAIRREPSRAVS